MSRLKEKTAIVFGGGQIDGETIGNGRATALTFARNGARLLIADISLAAAEETCRQVEEEGGRARAVQADVTSEADCEAVAEACMEAFGQIDVLFNNVGVGAGDGPVERLMLEAWNGIMDANVAGMFLTCKQVLPHMRQRRRGAVINMSSMMSLASDATMTSASEDPEAAGCLASDEAGFITNVLLSVDGGQSGRIG